MRFPTPWNNRPAGTASPSDASPTPEDTDTRSIRTARRRRTRRQRTVVATAFAATALIGGTGFVVHSTGADASAFGTAATSTASASGTSSLTDRSTVTRAKANSEAQLALATGHQVAQAAKGKVDATPLTTSLASLANYQKLSPDAVENRVDQTRTAAAAVSEAATVVDKKTAAQAAARAAAEKVAAAQAKADAERQAAANTPAGAQATARTLMASQYGWGSDQFSCLSSLWTKESGWSYTAYNPNGGATGIPQALPGSKMASVASDWSTNATTQVIWGLKYIAASYGTPCSAWAHSQSVNWY